MDRLIGPDFEKGLGPPQGRRRGACPDARGSDDRPGVAAADQAGQRLARGRPGRRRRSRSGRAPGRRTSPAAPAGRSRSGTGAALRRRSAGRGRTPSTGPRRGRRGRAARTRRRRRPRRPRPRRRRSGAMPLRAVLDAEPDRLALDERDDRVGLGVGLLDRVEGAVVEDRAVLVDLHQRGAPVGRGGREHRGEVLAVGVDRAGDERAPRRRAPARPG